MHPRHFAVLRGLRDGGEHSQQQLASSLGIPASRLVGLLSLLIERSLVERRESPSDARVKLVRLRGAGRVGEVDRARRRLGAATDCGVGGGPGDRPHPFLISTRQHGRPAKCIGQGACRPRRGRHGAGHCRAAARFHLRCLGGEFGRVFLRPLAAVRGIPVCEEQADGVRGAHP
ncbi:MarR family winged helix-turn-helix transcriptional regulator [Streptomyces noursei]|uniref:MarR family winged helix-turn-helix transcriptional regulator n=1 Tax=Streptomyces noursei TaxID=1971 RepID=UPI0039AF0CA4